MDAALALADWNGFAGATRGSASDAASSAASASPIISRSPAGIPRERAEVTVQPEGRVELVHRHAWQAARATRPASRNSSTIGSASVRGVNSSPMTPTSSRSAAAAFRPLDALAGVVMGRRRTRSSRRASRSPRICSKPPPPTSSSATALPRRGHRPLIGIFEVAGGRSRARSARRSARAARRASAIRS